MKTVIKWEYFIETRTLASVCKAKRDMATTIPHPDFVAWPKFLP